MSNQLETKKECMNNINYVLKRNVGISYEEYSKLNDNEKEKYLKNAKNQVNLKERNKVIQKSFKRILKP